MHQAILVLISFFLSIYILNAQDPPYVNYGTKDGLPSQEVYDVEIDSAGLLWFATDRGVCTFDGYDFKTYTTKDGLADNVNFEILKDSKNRLWFSGYARGSTIYENGHFSPVFDNDTLVRFLDKAWASMILESDKGNFYTMRNSILNSNYTMFKVNPGQTPVKLEESQLMEAFEPIIIDENHLFPLGEYGFTVNRHFIDASQYYLNSSTAYKSKGNWFYQDSKNVYTYNKEKGEQSSFNFDAIVGGMYFDQKDNLWVFTGKGVYFFENGILNKEPIVYFKDKNITSITEDKEGAFWLSSVQSGIYFIPSFDVVPLELDEKYKNYYSTETLKQHIVFGGKYSNLLIVDSLGRKSNYNLERNDRGFRFISKFGNELVLPFYRIFEKNGVAVIEKYERANRYFSKKLSNGHLLKIDPLRELSVINAMDEEIFFSRTPKIAFNSNTTCAVEVGANIWIGTLEGLYKITNFNYENIEQVLINGEEVFGRVNDIYPDQFGNRWLATIGNGLIYYANNKVFSINKKDGLNSDMINHVLLLNDSTVYLATNKGVNAFNYTYENDTLVYSTIKSLTVSDGLISNFIKDVDYWKEKIWLVTDNGICYFEPGLIDKEYPEVTVTINELFVNDSSYTISEELVFENNENDVNIFYTGISFRKDHEENFYRYRLIANDEVPRWIYTNDKSIRYNNMRPGAYTFEIAAKNKSDIWTSLPTSISFTIKPHFSETFWFRFLAILIGCILIGSFIYFQNKRIRFREYEKRQLQEAELNALRNQMNPHFVFNSLNAIQSFMFKNDIENANYYMSKFAVLMRNSLQYTRLDFITLQEEIDFVQNYLELEKMRFSDKFEFEINTQDSIDLDFIQVPSLLLQPILENSIKHAFKNVNYKGLIVLDIKEKDENSLEVFIRDNGVGYSDVNEYEVNLKTKHKSLGLEIIKERIALLNSKNFKTKASVDFVNLSDLKKGETGLQVYFILPIKNVQ